MLNLLTLEIGYLAANHVGKKYQNKIIIAMEGQESLENKKLCTEIFLLLPHVEIFINL